MWNNESISTLTMTASTVRQNPCVMLKLWSNLRIQPLCNIQCFAVTKPSSAAVFLAAELLSSPNQTSDQHSTSWLEVLSGFNAPQNCLEGGPQNPKYVQHCILFKGTSQERHVWNKLTKLTQKICRCILHCSLCRKRHLCVFPAISDSVLQRSSIDTSS